MASDSTLELVSLSKRYGDVLAVDHINLKIPAGTYCCLLGPSGCGKTSTLRMIAGFDQPTAGRVLLHGEDVTELPPFDRDANTVFQDYALFPHMTVRDNVAYGLKVRGTGKGERRDAAEQALEQVRLGGYGDRKPSQLSGGQRQRVALARAHVLRPSVLLLDEPLGALDQQLREEMQLELKSLQRDVGITFILVTHDQGEALAITAANLKDNLWKELGLWYGRSEFLKTLFRYGPERITSRIRRRTRSGWSCRGRRLTAWSSACGNWGWIPWRSPTTATSSARSSSTPPRARRRSSRSWASRPTWRPATAATARTRASRTAATTWCCWPWTWKAGATCCGSPATAS
jgi:ABC-type nitrate/sulfonate/bicarbonate transport system ATPase subunit